MSIDFYTISILPHAGIIIKICRAYTNSQEDFEDYYQEVCLQIWKSKDNFKEESEWSTWVYRLSLNVCLTLLKKNKNDHKFIWVQFTINYFSILNDASCDHSINRPLHQAKKYYEIISTKNWWCLQNIIIVTFIFFKIIFDRFLKLVLVEFGHFDLIEAYQLRGLLVLFY